MELTGVSFNVTISPVLAARSPAKAERTVPSRVTSEVGLASRSRSIFSDARMTRGGGWTGSL